MSPDTGHKSEIQKNLRLFEMEAPNGMDPLLIAVARSTFASQNRSEKLNKTLWAYKQSARRNKAGSDP